MYMPQVTLPALTISLLSISGTLLSLRPILLTLHPVTHSLRHFTHSLLHITLYSLSAPLLTLSYTLLSLPFIPSSASAASALWPCLRTLFIFPPLLYGRYGCISMPALWPDSASPSRVDISPKSIFSIRMTLPRRVMSAARRIFTSYAVWLSFSSKLST